MIDPSTREDRIKDRGEDAKRWCMLSIWSPVRSHPILGSQSDSLRMQEKAEERGGNIWATWVSLQITGYGKGGFPRLKGSKVKLGPIGGVGIASKY